MTQVTPAGRPRVAVIQFPGSNCDRDCFDVLARKFGVKAQAVWHQERLPDGLDAIVIPGGFSYGDYLRGGALAAHSPIMADVKGFVAKGGPVIGICNGFQVLTESRLLPGALLRNASRKFICKVVNLKAGSGKSTYQAHGRDGVLKVPIAHGEGRYYIDDEGLRRLEGEGLIAYRYVDDNGDATAAANPNGAVGNIAGVVSENGRVMGLMPHPERAADALLGSEDGLRIWEAFFASFL